VATKTRKVSSRQRLAVDQQIILPDEVRVVRESEVVEWVIDGNHSVTRAAHHFGVSTSVIRRILSDAGVKPAEQLTVWARPTQGEPAEPAAE
jgi:Zn-dependent peptidase ImmA (M78 family)